MPGASEGAAWFHATPDQEFPVSIPRRSAVRLLLLSRGRRLLLLKHAPPLHTLHWAGPGGGIDAGESPDAALERELREEVLISAISNLRTVGEWRHVFAYRGEPVVQHERLFAADLGDGLREEDVSLGPNASSDGISDLRWWTEAKLRTTPEPLWPDRLLAWMREQQ